jgi:hypothetical protein
MGFQIPNFDEANIGDGGDDDDDDDDLEDELKQLQQFTGDEGSKRTKAEQQKAGGFLSLFHSLC